MIRQWKPEFIFNYLYSFKRSRQLLDFTQLIYPQMIEVQLTDVCNLNCSFCNARGYRQDGTNIVPSSIGNFIVYLSKKGLRAVTFEGGGEPSLYRWLRYVVHQSVKYNVKCGIITNGVSLIDEDVCKHLSYIRVSLDAYDRDNYLNVKGSDYFDAVIENIKTYACYKNLILGVSFVVTDNNCREKLFKLYEYLEPYISYLQIKPDENYISDYTPVHLSGSKIFEVNCTGNGSIFYDDVCTKCYTNQLTSTIRANGDVLFCKRMRRPVVIGNIYSNTVDEIYVNNRIKQNLVLSVLDTTKFRDMCNIPCRMKKYNYVINEMLNYDERTKYFL